MGPMAQRVQRFPESSAEDRDTGGSGNASSETSEAIHCRNSVPGDVCRHRGEHKAAIAPMIAGPVRTPYARNLVT